MDYIACQAPLSMEYPRQEYWSGLPFASPGDLLFPGIEPVSTILASRFFSIEPPGKPCIISTSYIKKKKSLLIVAVFKYVLIEIRICIHCFTVWTGSLPVISNSCFGFCFSLPFSYVPYSVFGSVGD